MRGRREGRSGWHQGNGGESLRRQRERFPRAEVAREYLVILVRAEALAQFLVDAGRTKRLRVPTTSAVKVDGADPLISNE